MSLDSILAQINDIRMAAEAQLSAATTADALETLRVDYLGKKGKITAIMAMLKDLTSDEKKVVGKEVNTVKSFLETTIKEKKDSCGPRKSSGPFLDYSLPGKMHDRGRIHPITQTLDRISRIFRELGFQVVDGREVETERYNFSILNIPLDHPARDGFDTFYTDRGVLLRSQTSTAQGRIMERFKPPLAAISFGKVYRPDTVDACHSFMFHQMEGFLVDVNVTFSDLKGVLHLFAKKFFGPDTNIRFRPHFFPFTEPSVEVDVTCVRCHGKGCALCKISGWIEILGAGSINPAVFMQVGYDPEKYKGFAFGLGIERICMLKYGIHDIRMFYENDVRFLRQF